MQKNNSSDIPQRYVTRRMQTYAMNPQTMSQAGWRLSLSKMRPSHSGR